MSETFWEAAAAVEAQPQSEAQNQHHEQGALAVTADDFSGLEQRVLRAVEVVKRERQERTAAEARAAQAEERAAQAEMRAAQVETQVREQSSSIERMQSELNALKAERDHVRQRVERLLQQLDGLEL